MNKTLAGLVFVATFVLPGTGFAHSPIFNCSDNGDGTISCEGGFSDGSSAANVTIHIQDSKGKMLEDLKLDSNSELTFKKPEGDYKVVFDAGAGHSVTVSSKDIVE